MAQSERDPIDEMDEAIMAFEGLCDLVVSNEAGDMHLVTPSNLWFLLQLLLDRFQSVRAHLAKG